MNKTLKFAGGLLTGIGLGIGACALKRDLDRTVDIMTGLKPDACKGFECEGLHCINTGGVTCYLLKGENGYLLIDTGYPKGWDAFRIAFAKTGVAIDEITTLLLTHSHYDHLGFAAQVLALSDAQLILHNNALTSLSGGMQNLGSVRPLNIPVLLKLMLTMPMMARSFTAVQVPIENALIIDDDSGTLHALGFDADILVTPGHSPDSLTVLGGDGCAFVGDLLMNMPIVEDMHYRPILLSDHDVLLASWRKLLDAGAQTIYPAHGAPIPRDKVEQALRMLE